MINHDLLYDIIDFVTDLHRQEVAPKTVTIYRSALAGFVR